MPRANRHILPGYIYHLTHRCHNKNFLLRCRCDRVEYLRRLRKNVHEHHLSLFDFCITCNHVHILTMCKELHDLSRFMQQLEGEFADFYNTRKNRSGSFWGERFHCTMIDGGKHLWNCLRYIDLNMVRAGMVSHPDQWPWCGYRELIGKRKRYRLMDIDRLLLFLGLSDQNSLAEIHRRRIQESIDINQLDREIIWTESIAVGGKDFLQEIVSQTKSRKRIYISTREDGTSYIREKLD
jgi:putative transposase